MTAELPKRVAPAPGPEGTGEQPCRSMAWPAYPMARFKKAFVPAPGAPPDAEVPPAPTRRD